MVARRARKNICNANFIRKHGVNETDALHRRQLGFCAMSYKRYTFERYYYRMASNDRCNNSVSYTIDNQRLVLCLFNVGNKMHWNEEVFRRFQDQPHDAELGKFILREPVKHGLCCSCGGINSRPRSPYCSEKCQSKHRRFCSTDEFIRYKLKDAYRRTRRRNKSRNSVLVDTLTLQDVLDMARETACRCGVSNHPMRMVDKPGCPFRMSIDRINDRLPYTRANCRLVCAIFNCPGKWTRERFQELVMNRAANKAAYERLMRDPKAVEELKAQVEQDIQGRFASEWGYKRSLKNK